MPHPRLSFVGLIAAAGLRFACGTAFAQDACAGVPALAKSLQATTIVSAKMTPASPAQVETVRRVAGPDRFDALTAMERWVEQEKPPASMIATKANSPLSRPLCPSPQVSRYKGAIRTTPRTSRA